MQIKPTVESVDRLFTEDEKMAFIQAYRDLIRIKNALGSYTDFDWDDLPMSEQTFEDYKSKYLDLYEGVKGNHQEAS